jgi:hypothetical protein
MYCTIQTLITPVLQPVSSIWIQHFRKLEHRHDLKKIGSSNSCCVAWKVH